MKRMSSTLFTPLVLTLCLSTTTGGAQRLIQSIKLLNPKTGWAATDQKLLWTVNGGTNWNDITPKSRKAKQSIESVFFLDPSTGWVLMRCGDDKNSDIDGTCFEFASTTDAGQSWSIVHPTRKFFRTQLVDPGDVDGFNGRTYLDFADSRHGWVILKEATGAASSTGIMLRTVDGGHHWSKVKNRLPVAEVFHFTTQKDGWMAGGGSQLDPYTTHDGGDSWREVDALSDLGSVLPKFENERDAWALVRNTLLATHDAGKTWTPDLIMNGLGIYGPMTITDSTVIAARSDSKHHYISENQYYLQTELSLYTLGPDGNPSIKMDVIPYPGDADELSFIGRDRGWIRFSGSLLATENGGRSWVDVTPGSPPPTPPRVSIQGPVRTVPKSGVHVSHQELFTLGACFLGMSIVTFVHAARGKIPWRLRYAAVMFGVLCVALGILIPRSLW